MARIIALIIGILEDRNEINDARRALIERSSDYTVESIWIMAQHKACSPEDAEQLLRTPAIHALISKHQSQIDELMESFSDWKS